jgi:nucleotide-binding universal stress UspA family protein
LTDEIAIIKFRKRREAKGGPLSMEKNEKILVPLDGSECAEYVIPRVEELAERQREGICLLRVALAHTFPGVDQTEAQLKVVREAEEYLHGWEDRLKAKGFDVDTHVRYGNEAEEILDHAARKEIDLIAMSARRHRGIRHFFQGCLAEKILRHTQKPVFLVQCSG